MADKLRIKFSARTAATQNPALWLSLFKERKPEIGPCKFIFDPEARDYDWFVVYEDLMFRPGESKSFRKETLSCARENTLFITTEPRSIKIYGRQYLRQFGHVLSAQPRTVIDHKGHIFSPPPLRWYYGRPLDENDGHYTDIDSYKSQRPILKSSNISTVCSDKQMSPALAQRYDFTARLNAELGDDFDWFGRGIRPISNKAEAMDSYRFHLAIENHIEDHHWTEKIMDCFLAFCLPFYHGPSNIFEYFPEDSLIQIDINDVETTASIIRQAMRDNLYERRLPAIIKARDKVLSSYNLMTRIAEIVQTHHQPLRHNRNAAIYGRHSFRRHHPFAACRDILHRYKHRP